MLIVDLRKVFRPGEDFVIIDLGDYNFLWIIPLSIVGIIIFNYLKKSYYKERDSFDYKEKRDNR